MPGQGSIAVIAAWTATGHQAMRNAVDLLDGEGGDIVTAFHPESETARTLLYGSNFVEIQPSTTGSALNSSQTFTFSNDVDAIGTMWARIKITAQSDSSVAPTDFPALSLARIIDRMEVMVGNSTWQTIENADICAMAATTLDYGAYEVFDLQARGRQIDNQKLLDAGDTTTLSTSATAKYVAWVPLPTFTQGGPERAHLVAGAPHQSVRVKLTYADSSALAGLTGLEGLEVQIWNRQHVMSNAEREQIRSNVVAKTIHLTQHQEETKSRGSNVQVVVELDSFSLLCSHLIICCETIGEPAETQAYLDSAELLLNTSTHSGPLTGPFMLSAAGSSMGLKTNVQASLTAGGVRRDFYVFPLASTPFGSDGCPFNRFDTIRLKTIWGQFTGKIHVTAVGTTTAVYKNQAASVLYFS